MHLQAMSYLQWILLWSPIHLTSSHSQIEKVLLECPSSSLNVQEKEGLGLVALVLALGKTVLKQIKQIECMQQKLAIIEAQQENSTPRIIETQHDPIKVQTGC